MFERQSSKILDIWDKSAEAVLTPELNSVINKHAILGALSALLPLFGFESILYAIVLWHMYGSVSRMVGIPFSFSTVAAGVIINILVCILAGLFDMFIGIAWIISAVIMYFLTYHSGKTFLGLLYKMYKNHKKYGNYFQVNQKVIDNK